jgi:membrane protein
MADRGTDHRDDNEETPDDPARDGRGPTAAQAGSQGAGDAPDQPTKLGVRGGWVFCDGPCASSGRTT